MKAQTSKQYWLTIRMFIIWPISKSEWNPSLVTEERVVPLQIRATPSMPMRLVSYFCGEIVETRDELTAAAEIVKDLGIKELGFEDEGR